MLSNKTIRTLYFDKVNLMFIYLNEKKCIKVTIHKHDCKKFKLILN